MNSNYSIYIPRMKATVTEDFVHYVFYKSKIGEVMRVDFTPINKKPGFGENVDGVVKSAFVHLIASPHNWQLFPEGRNFLKEVYTGNGHKFYPGEGHGYWLVLPAKRPIMQTMMNTSQIVENGRHLENLIAEQAKTIEDQAYKIEELSEKLDSVHQVVYQLLGGLFNHETQGQTLQDHIDVLNSEDVRRRGRFEDPDDSKWESWPTTRQGDESERRIEALEQTVREMLNFDYPEPVFRPEEDDEQQDSDLQARKFAPEPYRMPTDEDLFEEDSVSTHSSMPDLEEVSVDSEERIRNSFELCGNE